MDLLLRIYLVGMLFNLVVLIYNFIREYKMSNLDKLSAIFFIIASWIIYPLVFWKSQSWK